jgi:MoaA/NifB/PqqE/SkfB family radical SAM enzyme
MAFFLQFLKEILLSNTASIQLVIFELCNKATVMRNLQHLSKIKKPEMVVKLAVTKQRENKNDIENIQTLASNFGFEVFLRNLHSRSGALVVKEEQTVNLLGCGILPKVTFVAANGDVLSCCQDLAGKFVLGNINHDTFEDVLKEKKRVIEQDDWFPICKHCDDEYRYLLLANDLI